MRDETIRQLEQGDIARQNEMSLLVYKENEALKQENRMMRDKVTILEEELHRLNETRPHDADVRALQEEAARLNRALIDKDSILERQIADQKNEWAEVYGQQKQQLEAAQMEI